MTAKQKFPMATQILKSQSDAAKTTSNTLHTSDFHFHKNLIVSKLNLNKNLAIASNADGVTKQAFVNYVTIVQHLTPKSNSNKLELMLINKKFSLIRLICLYSNIFINASALPSTKY